MCMPAVDSFDRDADCNGIPLCLPDRTDDATVDAGHTLKMRQKALSTKRMDEMNMNDDRSVIV